MWDQSDGEGTLEIQRESECYDGHRGRRQPLIQCLPSACRSQLGAGETISEVITLGVISAGKCRAGVDGDVSGQKAMSEVLEEVDSLSGPQHGPK
jgi:hypothetical protein